MLALSEGGTTIASYKIEFEDELNGEVVKVLGEYDSAKDLVNLNKITGSDGEERKIKSEEDLYRLVEATFAAAAEYMEQESDLASGRGN